MLWVLQLPRTYRTLGMLLDSGVSVLVAMRMTETSLPLAMRARMRVATQAVSEGKPMCACRADFVGRERRQVPHREGE
jgi:general secretion pathway protein F